MRNFIILIVSIFSANFVLAQNNIETEKPVYLRFPTVPQFTVYQAPDSTSFTRNDLDKKKSTIFFIFSPDCGHCQMETAAIIKDIKKFKNTHILMVTHFPYEEMIRFYKQFKIANYPQLIMARDTKYFFPVFFGVKNFPSIFVYDKKGNFKKAFEGDVKVDDIIKEL